MELAFVLDLLELMKITPTFHVSRLKHFVESEDPKVEYIIKAPREFYGFQNMVC